MGRHHLGKRAFAFNRWSVGCDASDGSVAAKQTARDIRKGDERARKYKQLREKAKIRPELMRIDPHCHRCRLRLQDQNPALSNYASVIGIENAVLCCLGCVRELASGAKVESFGEGVLP